MSVNDQSYFPKLDGLRAVAIALVLVEHFGGMLPKYFDAGYLGVDLFFVISGYLITLILVQSEGNFRNSYTAFLGRRTLRSFPVYYIALLVMFVLNIGQTRRDIGYLATYTWNYASDRWSGSDIFYLWSLSVEEQFYLLWPLVVLLLRNCRKTLLGLSLMVVAVGYSQLLFNIFPALSTFNYTGLINRMGSLGLGAAGAVWTCRFRVPAAVLRNGIVEAIVLSSLVWSQGTQATMKFPVMGLCSLFLVLKAVHGEFRLPLLSKALGHSTMQYLGRISYGVYVYHIPLAILVNKFLFDPIWLSIPFDQFGIFSKLRWNSWIIKLPLYTALAVLLASASWRWFEKPILAMKDVWFPSRKLVSPGELAQAKSS